MTKKIISRRHSLSLIVAGLAFLLSGCFKNRIILPTGSQSATRPRSGSSSAIKIVNTARTQLGVKYRLGGNSPSSGFDCSGLIHWAYKQHGITVPRVTRDQAYTGRMAPLNKLNPGDILVFAQSAAPNDLHTALYVGNNKFIHSPNSKSVVREESLTTAYWKKSLVLARRVI